ncbi:MAG: FAD:protein FMN transferase [Gammaproteobacteria bacterium]|nr:FAD:protein FMN transferase [Gammaproteobacteria bacterium]
MRYFLLSVICFLPLASCQSERPAALHEFTGLTMGTSWSVMINAGALPLPRQQLKAQFDSILDRANGEMSTYLPESELSMINAADSAGRIPVSRPLMQVLQAAREVSRLTQGGFDVTVGPLVNLWGFGPEQDFTVPGQEQVDAALRMAGYEYLHLDPAASALKKAHGGIQIDLSAIAKGYGVDEIADYLERLQLDNYLVEIGGEIRARGVNREQAPWQIGIEQPVAGQRGVQRIIKLDNMAMATSGDYRNFFEQDGNRYSHTIDPRTGRPVSHGLASVTVLHPSAMLADAWATGLLVLGPEQGYATAMENGLDAYFIVRTDTGIQEKSTPGFQRHRIKAYN